MVYMTDFAKVRQHDIQSKIEFLDVYLWMENTEKWQKLATELVNESKTDPNKIKGILQRIVNLGKFEFAHTLLKFMMSPGSKG